MGVRELPPGDSWTNETSVLRPAVSQDPRVGLTGTGIGGVPPFSSLTLSVRNYGEVLFSWVGRPGKRACAEIAPVLLGSKPTV